MRSKHLQSPVLVHPAVRLFLYLILCSSNPRGITAFSATIHVPADIATIQAAIDSATHGDEIVVATGTYTQQVQFKGKIIVLRSTDPTDPGVVAATVLDLGFDDEVVVFAGTETDECVLSGFTITRGYTCGILGRGTHATIENNFVFDNYGSGLYYCNGLIQNNLVSENSDYSGGGLYYCNGFIQNNLITNNVAVMGAGLYLCNGIIQNNTFHGNRATGRSYSAIAPGIGSSILECTGTIRNCILWGEEGDTQTQVVDSATPQYCCIQNWEGGGEGNLFCDPLFVNSASGDFRLQAGSYCIDSGSLAASLTVDREGASRGVDGATDPRGDGSNYDIGAYEFSGTAPPNHTPLTPSNLSPGDGATGLSLAPVLECSALSDPDAGDLHTATQWQIDDDPGFSSPEIDTGIGPGNLTRLRASGGALEPNTAYSWRVRQMDHRYAWSDWSVPSTFQTENSFGDALFVPNAFPTIQAAIDGTSSGGRIVIRGGFYRENIQFGGKNIRLQSLDPTDPEIVEATILDGDDNGAVVTFSGSENEDCVLAGFTIQNGNSPLGGGIRGNRTHATIEWNRITHNEATSGGGFDECDGTIRNNRVLENRVTSEYVGDWYLAGKGGAFSSCDGHIYNNLIYDNQGDHYGGAFYSCHGTIEFNTLCFNDAWYGSGFYDCTAHIANNIIWDSLYGSRSPVYCLIRWWEAGGQGNLSTNPRFVNAGNSDFRLRPDSPCIDAGGGSYLYPDSDIVSATRPYDSTSLERGDGNDYDIGAYEYIGQAEPNPAPNRPVNVSPEDGTDVIGYNPLLVSSPFSDPDPTDFHVKSEWQVCENDGFAESDLVSYSWTDEEDLLQIEALLDPEDYLEPASTYWWRVRHLDGYARWSEWSLATSFNTRPATAPLLVPHDFSTIQSAIDHAVEGGVIVVATGTHHENLDFLEKGITLRSTDPLDATVVAQTVLVAKSSQKPGILFENIWYDSQATLSGFTISGGALGIDCNYCYADLLNNVILYGPVTNPGDRFKNNRIEGGKGIVEPGNQCVIEGNTILSGGINGRVYQPAIVNNLISGIDGTAISACHGPIRGNTITLCTGRAITGCNGLIEGNTITYNGAGAIGECDGTIRKNIISHNTTPNSGAHGAGVTYCDGLIECNLVFRNMTDASGGGISGCNGTIRNNFVFENHAARGAAGLAKCSGSIYNNTIVNNISGDVGGGFTLCSGEIKNNIVWGNVATQGAQFYESSDPSFCCIEGWNGAGDFNIIDDPQFVDSDNGDFRLLQTSPCIDAGAYVPTVTEDYWGDQRGLDGVEEDRGDGSNYDTGADEFLGKQLFHLGSDINLNGWVDVFDLLIFLPDWHSITASNERSDINNDSEVNPADLRILMKDWRRGTGPS